MNTEGASVSDVTRSDIEFLPPHLLPSSGRMTLGCEEESFQQTPLICVLAVTVLAILIKSFTSICFHIIVSNYIWGFILNTLIVLLRAHCLRLSLCSAGPSARGGRRTGPCLPAQRHRSRTEANAYQTHQVIW